jgi:hypothetical protein
VSRADLTGILRKCAKTSYSDDPVSTCQRDCLRKGTKHDQTPCTASSRSDPPNTVAMPFWMPSAVPFPVPCQFHICASFFQPPFLTLKQLPGPVCRPACGPSLWTFLLWVLPLEVVDHPREFLRSPPSLSSPSPVPHPGKGTQMSGLS